MNKKMLIGLGIGVGVVAVVGLVFGAVSLFRKNQEPDDIDDDEEDFLFDDYLEVEPDDDTIDDIEDIEMNLYQKIVQAGYKSSDFTEDQLRGLSYSFDQGYDISQVLNPEYNGDQMVAIASGINNGYDPKYFANSKLSHLQILTIIKGLANNVDVTVYAKPEYTEKQMEICLNALLVGIKVTPDDLTEPELMQEKINTVLKQKREEKDQQEE